MHVCEGEAGAGSSSGARHVWSARARQCCCWPHPRLGRLSVPILPRPSAELLLLPLPPLLPLPVPPLPLLLTLGAHPSRCPALPRSTMESAPRSTCCLAAW